MKLRSSKKPKDDDEHKDNEENSSKIPKNPVSRVAFCIFENILAASPEDNSEEAKTEDASEESSSDKTPKAPATLNGGLKSVLLVQKRKGPKKTLKWKTELESIRYFELDETERVNVTKTFTDMKILDNQNEREAFRMARKLCNEDHMEEKTMWRQLIQIELDPPLAEPGVQSDEKNVQFAREKGILQALYPSRSM